MEQILLVHVFDGVNMKMNLFDLKASLVEKTILQSS